MSQYSIRDLEKLSGVKAHTIRIWEKRYTLLQPERTDTNIRYYSDEDLKKLLNVASLVKNGHRISKVAGLCNEVVRQEVLKIEEQQSCPDKRIDQLVRLMVNLNTLEFGITLDKVFFEMGTEEAVAKVIFPFLEKTGILWQIGSILPAHEHFVSNLIRNKLISETDKLPKPKFSKPVLLFLKEDEWHELGLLFFNFILRKSGYPTIYLGADVLLKDLTEIANRYQFEMVVTAFVNAIEKELLEDYLKRLSGIFGTKKIIISGLQIRLNKPELPSSVVLTDTTEAFFQQLKSF